MKRVTGILFCIILVSIEGYCQNADSIWVVNHYTKMETLIPMRDGVKLFTAIYIPKDHSEKHPILMKRTPYSAAPYGKDNFWNFWNYYLKEYLKEGYIMVIQDVRGRWMSEGEFINVRPLNKNKGPKDIDESTDSYDTIDWMVKNLPDNNGKVGVFGISYPGFYSTMAAASNHPALVAVSPQAPVTNWFIGDDFHHNGAFFIMDAFDFYSQLGSGMGQPHPVPTQEPPLSIGYNDHDNYKFYLETGALPNFTKLMGYDVPFWNDLYNHPNYDAYWKERDARNATKNLKPAMLWVGGEFDAEDNWGAWNSYLAAEKNNPGKSFNKLVMGPWYHEQWLNNDGTHLGNITFGSNTSDYYQKNIEVPFFNYFLKGKGDISTIAEANIFMTGANEWKKYDQWPPAGIQEKRIYLQPGGKLGWTPSSAATSFTEYVSDPFKPVPYTEDVHFNRTREYMTDDQRFAGRRPDVLEFKTPILDKDIVVTGNVAANITTSISTTDADFVVKLIDVFPDSLSYNNVDIYADADPVKVYPMGGYEMLVHGEIFRGKFRNSYENPEPFTPGKIDHVNFKMGDVAHTFKKGHRIMIQIQSSWFPLVDRNPQKFTDIYHATDADFQKANIRIYHDGVHQSSIVLPVLNP